MHRVHITMTTEEWERLVELTGARSNQALKAWLLQQKPKPKPRSRRRNPASSSPGETESST